MKMLEEYVLKKLESLEKENAELKEMCIRDRTYIVKENHE